MTELAKRALEIAMSQIGEEEKPRGSNWGNPVSDYLARVGISFPASWCMAFVYWCFDEADEHIHPEANGLSMSNPLPRTGGVLNAWSRANSTNKTLKDPQQGDIFIMDFGGGLGHTGIVEKVENGMLHTIEGNTNDTGSREGYEVCRRVRDPKKIKGYLRY